MEMAMELSLSSALSISHAEPFFDQPKSRPFPIFPITTVRRCCMAGKELGFLKPSVPSLKEQLARKTLRNVRLQGHKYVDLREDGKRYIFFCTLCLAPCYSDAVLYDHLRGNLHKERYAGAKATLMGQNPWPFDDGVFFFRNTDKPERDVSSSQGNSRVNVLDDHEHVDDLAIVVHSSSSKVANNGHSNGFGKSTVDCSQGENSCDDEDVFDDGGVKDFVIPGVIGKEAVSDLRVKLMGYGQISARFCEKDGVHSGIHRLWCEWMGDRGNDCDEINSVIPTMDFAIVTFGYYYDLGKQGLFDEVKTLLLTSGEDSGKVDGSRKRRKKSFSDSDDVSETSNYQCDSSGEDSQGSNATSSALLLHHWDDHFLQSRIMSSKSLRRELRRQQRVASEKTCDICQHKMLPGKDVATLLNLKTGRLACSSRNVHGAFHVFHTSCLIHWILLCEFEMFMNPPRHPKIRRRSKRVKSKHTQVGKECGAKLNGLKRNQSRKESDAGILCDQICSVFCPDCQGTGLEIEGDELEKPTVHLSQVFKYKIQVSDAHRGWMKCPEKLENCSTGFAFSVQNDDAQEKAAPMKLLHFYRAYEEG